MPNLVTKTQWLHEMVIKIKWTGHFSHQGDGATLDCADSWQLTLTLDSSDSQLPSKVSSLLSINNSSTYISEDNYICHILDNNNENKVEMSHKVKRSDV